MKKYFSLFMMFFSINIFASENSLTNIQQRSKSEPC